jgi:hypothetical protein
MMYSGGNPLEGILVMEDEIVRRFYYGLPDGDSYTRRGSGSPSLWLKAPAILNTGGKGCLYRDGGLPAVSSPLPGNGWKGTSG